MGPPDPIIGLADAFRADDFPQKVIVGVGAYRDDQGKPEVLPCVREAEKILMESNLDHEYSGIVSCVAWCLYAPCNPILCLTWFLLSKRLEILRSWTLLSSLHTATIQFL